MAITTLLRTDIRNKDKESDVIFVIRLKDKSYKIATGFKCAPDQWNKETRSMKGKYNGSSQFNSSLRNGLTALEGIVENQTEFDIDQVRRIFERYLTNPEKFDPKEIDVVAQDKPNFSLVIESVIDAHRNEWSHGHKKKFRSIATKVNEHDPGFEVENFSTQWWQGYIDYCIDTRKNSHNTVHADAKVFRQLFEILLRRGYKFKEDAIRIKWNYIEPKIEPLTWAEVKLIADLDLSETYNPRFETSRYLWVLCAYLGQRWSDIERITEGNFYQKQVRLEDGSAEMRWYYRNLAQKTQKMIDIPLLDEAVDWLRRTKFKPPRLAQQKVNEDIKKIAGIAKLTENVLVQTFDKGNVVEKLIPKNKRIHIHTARHSYAVELAHRSIGMPYAEKFVSEMLGHASPTTTWRYLNMVQSNKDKIFFDIMKKSSIDSN